MSGVTLTCLQGYIFGSACFYSSSLTSWLANPTITFIGAVLIGVPLGAFGIRVVLRIVGLFVRG